MVEKKAAAKKTAAPNDGKAEAQTNDPVSKQAAKNAEKELEEGFRGAKVDPTPNENYTVAGVTANAPTPETDPGLAAEADDASRAGVGRFGENGEDSK
jgi:hypothetical protein